MTESFSALEHLRPYFPDEGPFRVIHIGDGAHARTAALFSLKTRAHNISVDPVLNQRLVEDWRSKYAIQRFEHHRARIEDKLADLNALPPLPTFVTFVHAHVHTDNILSQLNFQAAYALSCCCPGKQISKQFVELKSGADEHVLAEDNRFQVLGNALASA